MRILVIKSLFIPHESFLDTNIGTIDRFLDYLSGLNERYRIMIRIIGWICPRLGNGVRNIFIDHMDVLGGMYPGMGIGYEIWDKNLGKKYLLRELDTTYPAYRSYNYIIYADHDIAPIDCILSSRIALGETLGSREIAMVNFHQTPDNRHNPRAYEKKITIMDINFFYSDHYHGIASGCFITKPQYIELMGDLKSDLIYGDEDILIPKILSNHNLMSVIAERSVEHGYDDNNDYAVWKKNTILKIIMHRPIHVDADFWSGPPDTVKRYDRESD